MGAREAADGRMRVLHLADAGLGPGAAQAFGAALASGRCQLKELWLGGNALTADGALSVASSLVHCASLEKLWLYGTALDDAACPALAAAVTAAGSSLSELWLGANAVTDEGIAVLREALSRPAAYGGDGGKGCSLTKLWLDHTDGLSFDGASQLLDAAVASGALRMLWVGGQRLSVSDKEELEARASSLGGDMRLIVDTPLDEDDESGEIATGGVAVVVSAAPDEALDESSVPSPVAGGGGDGEQLEERVATPTEVATRRQLTRRRRLRRECRRTCVVQASVGGSTRLQGRQPTT